MQTTVDAQAMMAALVIIFFGLLIYFIPAIVAGMRNRAGMPVFLLNLLLGWTFLGWVVALVWASTRNTPEEREENARIQH
jgi:hypothetical protein